MLDFEDVEIKKENCFTTSTEEQNDYLEKVRYVINNNIILHLFNNVSE